MNRVCLTRTSTFFYFLTASFISLKCFLQVNDKVPGLSGRLNQTGMNDVSAKAFDR